MTVCLSLPFVTKGSGAWGKAPRSEKQAERILKEKMKKNKKQKILYINWHCINVETHNRQQPTP